MGRNRAVVATWLAEYCIQSLAVHVLFAKPADFEFPREKVRLALETEGGVTKLDGQMVMHAFTCILSSQRLRVRSTLVLCEQTRTAATRLVLAVILNSSETTSGPVSNGRALKMCS